MTERGDYRLTPEVVPLAIREASQKAILAVGLGAGSFVPMRSSKHFGPPVYLMGGLMIALPTIDLLLSVSPMRFGAAAWRFGAGGILTKGLLTPFLGLMIWFMAAWFLEHRVMLRVLAAIAAVASILLVLMSVSFALDALQMRPQVVPGAARTFAFTVATTLLKDRGILCRRAGVGELGVEGRPASKRGAGAQPDADPRYAGVGRSHPGPVARAGGAARIQVVGDAQQSFDDRSGNR